jgi:hypothetical protein
MSFVVPVTEAAAALGITAIVLHQFVGHGMSCERCGKPRAAHRPRKGRTQKRLND